MFLVGFLVAIAFISFSSFISGLVLSIMWGWFLVPTLGVPEIEIAQAIGIALVISFMTYQSVDTEPQKEDPWIKFTNLMIESVMRSVIVLIVGWVVHLFV